MISWIIASDNPQTLLRNMTPILADDEFADQVVLVENAASITLAYTEGQRRAIKPIRCFIHHDVQVLDLPRLRSELIIATETAHLVGVIGSRVHIMPWWNADTLGSVQDSRLGTIDFGPGGPCAVVDGLLLASRQNLPWDETWPGWHGYDQDICAQVSAAGQQVWCLTGGKNLVRHNSDSPFAVDAIDGWHDAADRYRKKWG